MDRQKCVINGSTSEAKTTAEDNLDHAVCIDPEIFPASLSIKPAPLNTDPESLKELANCDYTQRIDVETAKRGEQTRTLRVYLEGVFDLMHFGHSRCLWQAKTLFRGPVRLIVGVSADADCRANKREPLMTNAERVASVRHSRYADEVVPSAPWLTTPEFVAKHKIDFFCHDDVPYHSGDIEDIYAWLKEAGIFIATQRTPNISTTDLLERIRSRMDDSDFVGW